MSRSEAIRRAATGCLARLSAARSSGASMIDVLAAWMENIADRQAAGEWSETLQTNAKCAVPLSLESSETT